MPVKEDGTFQVKDRRLFNPDGTPREGEPEPINEPAGGGQASGLPEPPPEQQLPPASFLAFVFPLAAEALAHMGVGQPPDEKGPRINLTVAKHFIDTLGMLQEKTCGNLTPDEERHLNDILRDLRLQYVSLVNSKNAPSD